MWTNYLTNTFIMKIFKFITESLRQITQLAIFSILLLTSIIIYISTYPTDRQPIPDEFDIHMHVNSDTSIYMTKIDTQSVYAGRYDTIPTEIPKKNIKLSKYLSNGAPRNRTWLTYNEWKGSHCKSFKQRKAFKEWKSHQIDSFISYMSFAAVVESIIFPDIPPELIVAQSILESNFGKSRLASEANNFFGHKYNGSNKHLFVVAADDTPNDRFTKYRSLWFSIRGHSKILMNRYRKRIKGEPTLNNWLYALCGGLTVEQSKKWRARGNSVYATSCMTDVCYSQKLRSIINIYSLTERCSNFTKIGNV